MRKRLGLMVIMLAAPAGAATTYDSFDYPPGSVLDGQTSAGGKVWSAAGTPGAVVNIVPGLGASGGNAIQWGSNGGANSGAAERREIGNYKSGTVYWSLLF